MKFPRFVFELANNHNGSVDHGKRIIDNLPPHAIKFQYRDLSILGEQETKHHQRFRDTYLNDAERYELVEYTREKGFTPIVTPFDEKSVDMCVRHDIPILKVASCSADDWPLLEEMAKTGLPMIASTGGLDWQGIDRLYYFFKHRNVDFALMHCVAEYPTLIENCNLGVIDRMKSRYDVPIGYSGHEGGYAAHLAVAKGAEIIEFHVGMGDLNAYSLPPKEVWDVVRECEKAKQACGYKIVSEGEDLSSLQRDPLTLTMPRLNPPKESQIKEIRDAIHEYEAMFREANIPLIGDKELSHHYGVKNLKKTGAFLVTVVNREYCKKLIALLPGQEHPIHEHKKKSESFQVLVGELRVWIDDLHPRGGFAAKMLYPGEIVHIPNGVKHGFNSDTGCIFEEISLHSDKWDSFYEDSEIQKYDPMMRKTALD